jgi:gluconokinase
MAKEEVSSAPTVVLVLGVSGSGKSTVGSMLAGRLGWPYAEADDFHPTANRQKMAAGHALTDEDRWPWLETIAEWMDNRIAAGSSAVVTCSALKRSYRELLRVGRPEIRLVYLQGSRELISSRLMARQGHFFPAQLLETQFATLEEPVADEHPYVVPVGGTPEAIVDEILRQLELSGSSPRA